MSVAKPDSMSDGDPYAFGSKGVLVFQRVFFAVLFLLLIIGFLLFLKSILGGGVKSSIKIMGMEDASPFLNLGVPYHQADLDLITQTLKLEDEPLRSNDKTILSDIEKFLSASRELTSIVLYLKGYGDANGDAIIKSEETVSDATLYVDEQETDGQIPVDVEDDKPTAVPNVAVLRTDKGGIAAKKVIDLFFQTDGTISKKGIEPFRLLVLDCSHAVTNYRIGMFGNSFPGIVAEQFGEAEFAENSWILLPCGVNQLSFPVAESDPKSSAFAAAFANGMKGEADEHSVWGNQNGRVELNELYDFICVRCGFEFQTPILLNHKGEIVKPFTSGKSNGFGPVVCENLSPSSNLPPEATEPPKEDKKADQQSKENADDAPAKAGTTADAQHRRNSPYAILRRNGLASLETGQWLLRTPRQAGSLSSALAMASFQTSQDENKLPDDLASKKKSASSKGGDGVSHQPAHADQSKGAAREESPAVNTGEKQTLSENARRWDEQRSQLQAWLKNHNGRSFDFARIRHEQARAAEQDFRVRFMARNENSDSSVNLPSDEAPGTERKDLKDARDKAQSVGKIELFKNCTTAWDVLLSARFDLPAYVEWHDHLVVLNSTTASDLKARIHELLSAIRKLETEMLDFETPASLKVSDLTESLENINKSHSNLVKYVSASISDFDAAMLYSILRTPLLNGSERDTVANLLQEKLQGRSGTTMKARDVDKALLASQVSPSAAELHLTMIDGGNTQENVCDAYSGVSEQLEKLKTSQKMQDVLRYFQFASVLRAQDYDSAIADAPLPRLPVFPSSPELRLVLEGNEPAELQLKEPRTLKFTLELVNLDDKSLAANNAVKIKIQANQTKSTTLQFRAEPGEPEQPINESDTFDDLRLNEFGRLEFEIIASTDAYADPTLFVNATPAISITTTASANIGSTPIKESSVTANLRLPYEELMTLDVEGDPGIPKNVGSHLRTLRVLPNTLTNNLLKLKNDTLRARTVRVEVYSLKQLSDSAWTPGLLYSNDPSQLADASLFKRLEDAYKNNPNALIGQKIAECAQLTLPCDQKSYPIQFAKPAAGPVDPAPKTASAAAAAATPDLLPEIDISHGILMKVIDLEERKQGETVTFVETGKLWTHWLEVLPIHPNAIYKASAKWIANSHEVHVHIDKNTTESPDLQKSKVQYLLTDKDGWRIDESARMNLTEQDFIFRNVEASDESRSIFIDIDGYPRAFRVDVSCVDGRDSTGQTVPHWNHFRFARIGSEEGHWFTRQQNGFLFERKDGKGLPPERRSYESPFFAAKGNNPTDNVGKPISLGLQLDFPSESDRRVKAETTPGHQRITLSGSKELEQSLFPRDRNHTLTLADAGNEGTLTIRSKVQDWSFDWTPFTNEELVPITIGPNKDTTDDTARADTVNILIDGTAPKFRLSLSATTIELGKSMRLPVTVKLLNQDQSAPVERIEFSIVDAENPDKPFDEGDIKKDPILLWPTEATIELALDPEKLMLLPGRYRIKARATDALGQQNSSVQSDEFKVVPKPTPKPKTMDDKPKTEMGVVRVKFHVNEGSLKPKHDFVAKFGDETLKIPTDGMIEFKEEAAIGTPVKVSVKGRLGNVNEKSATIDVDPVPKTDKKKMKLFDLSKDFGDK